MQSQSFCLALTTLQIEHNYRKTKQKSTAPDSIHRKNKTKPKPETYRNQYKVHTIKCEKRKLKEENEKKKKKNIKSFGIASISSNSMGIQKKDEHTMVAFAHKSLWSRSVRTSVWERTARESYVGGVNFFFFFKHFIWYFECLIHSMARYNAMRYERLALMSQMKHSANVNDHTNFDGSDGTFFPSVRFVWVREFRSIGVRWVCVSVWIFVVYMNTDSN